MLPKHLLETVPADQIIQNDFNLAPVGSGPYRFEELTAEEGVITGVVLTRNETYFGAQPFIDQIVFRYYPNSPAALAAYQEGEVLGISQITPDILDQALAEENLAFYSSRQPELTLVIFNLDNPAKPFLQEKNVRLALLKGLNRQWMVDAFLGGQGIVADSVILPNTWAYYDGVDQVGYDPTAAQKMLDEAEYTLTGEDPSAARTILPYPLPCYIPKLNSIKTWLKPSKKNGTRLALKSPLAQFRMKHS